MLFRFSLWDFIHLLSQDVVVGSVVGISHRDYINESTIKNIQLGPCARFTAVVLFQTLNYGHVSDSHL